MKAFILIGHVIIPEFPVLITTQSTAELWTTLSSNQSNSQSNSQSSSQSSIQSSSARENIAVFHSLGEIGTLCNVLRIEKINANESIFYNLLVQGVERCRMVVNNDSTPQDIQDTHQGHVEIVKSTFDIPTNNNSTENNNNNNTLKCVEMLSTVQKYVFQKFSSVEIHERLSRLLKSLSIDRQSDLLFNLLSIKDHHISLQFLNCLSVHDRISLLHSLYTSLSTPNTTHNTSPNITFNSNNSMKQSVLVGYKKKLNVLIEKGIPEHALNAVLAELERLKRIPSSSPEYIVSCNYLDCILSLPWSTPSATTTTTNTDTNTDTTTTRNEVEVDVGNARRQLDNDHYGLEKVKTRITEYLSIRSLKQNLKGPIICLVGPPGVGKTSLGKSIAIALGRKFHRISLGGIRDVAEIKGHRRTYIGSMPGLIINALKTVQTHNPVILLDEIDKVGSSDVLRGDPSSALLEVLDPQQNSSFVDMYLNIPFDLSNVLFIATANTLDNISPPLRDRMEIISVRGYTIPEKCFIVKRYLLPKSCHEHGISPSNMHISDDLLESIVAHYTREPGVRSLEREICGLCRHVALQLIQYPPLDRPQFTISFTWDLIQSVLGPYKYDTEVNNLETRITGRKAGIVCGLAYNASGVGSVLFIESSVFRGSGKLVLTGKLGDVIKESIYASLSFLKSKYLTFGINTDFEKVDIHVHFPAGAVPKDGPSAGIAILCALLSSLTGIPCRKDTAMTGEITLSGDVLPVGGIREKVLAAHRARIKRVILPDFNRRDLVDDIPDSVKAEIEFVCVTCAEDVLKDVFGIHGGEVAVSIGELVHGKKDDSYSSKL